MDIEEYIVVSDEDTHRYIIPYYKLHEWNEFLELSSRNDSADVPEFAERIDGAQIVFKNYRLA